MDIEAIIITHLSDNGHAAFADVPEMRPDTFVTVELVGGANDGAAIERPSVVVQCWAPTRYEASQLAHTVDACVRSLPEVDDRIIKCTRNGLYNYPDLESGHPRYQILFNLVTFI